MDKKKVLSSMTIEKKFLTLRVKIFGTQKITNLLVSSLLWLQMAPMD